MSAHHDWIGRRTLRTEAITDRQISHFRAILGTLSGPGVVPAGLHWCLMPDVAESADLGRDGHPRLGLAVPDLGLPRRMWAGGALSFGPPLLPGDSVTRESTFTDIAFKTGSTGRLGFLTVAHEWSVAGKTRITERQDIVYREDPKPGSAVPPPAADAWVADRTWTVTPDPVLLFRYSALTFNSHRIHYDHPYATGVEGYGGLVVHGPLQATWMLNLATDMLGRLPARFRYRGIAPLICGLSLRIEARAAGADIALRVIKDDGVVTMQATATPEDQP